MRIAGVTAIALAAGSLLGTPAHAAAKAKAWDFNGDGRKDKVESNGKRVKITYAGGRVQRITRNSAGIPGKPTGKQFGEKLASADFDRDGRADLVISSPRSLQDDTLIVFGSRSGLTSRVSVLPFGGELTITDFARDGRPDLVVEGEHRLGVFQNPGRTKRPSGSYLNWIGQHDEFGQQSDALVADFTGDRYPDLAVVTGVPEGKAYGRVMLLRGGRHGLAKKAIATGLPAYAPLVKGDVDGDGIADLLSWQAASRTVPGDPAWTDPAVQVLRGGRSGFGAPLVLAAGKDGLGPAGSSLSSWAITDLNGDRKTDVGLLIESADGKTQSLTVVYGARPYKAPFTLSSTTLPAGTWRIAFADRSGDGRPDLIASTPQGEKILKNVNGRIEG